MGLLQDLTRKPIPSELAFPMEEYDERLERVRKSMDEGDLDALILTNPPNQCWLTGFQSIMSTGYSAAVIPAVGDVFFHLPELDVPCALLSGWVRDIVVFDWSYPLDVTDQLVEALVERGLHEGRIGIEMGRSETFAYGAMDASSFRSLSRSLPIARFDDATNLVQELRLRKSPRELEYMRQAGEFSWIGLQASIGAVAPGRTDNQVVAAGYEAMISAGSELMSIDPIIFVGERAGWAPHNMYKRVPLKVGDATYMEYSGNYQRYNAPMMRSVVIGPPSDGVRRLAEASIHTVELLIENIKPGRTGHDVAIAAKKGLGPVEDEIYFHRGYGYAVGLGFQPTWTEGPMYIAEGIERVLEPGMTFHLPMCIWVPGEYGVGFSETVVVTDTGCEVVTPGVRRELVVKP